MDGLSFRANPAPGHTSDEVIGGGLALARLTMTAGLPLNRRMLCMLWC
jgi:hypothetical protein